MNFEHSRFLIVRLSSIGDVLHATSVAHNLKLHYPSCHITWLASPPASELLQYNPDIDRLLVWDRSRFDKAVAGRRLREAFGMLRTLRKELHGYTFDIALDIQCLFLTGLITRLSGAPRRIGIYERHEFNHLFMTERGPAIDDPHKIRRYMTSLAPLGIHTLEPALILALPPKLEHFAEEFLPSHGISLAKPILMVNIRTTWPDKNWPVESFRTALCKLPEEIQLVFCGAPKDQHYIDEVLQGLPRSAVSIAGKTSLLELAALFRETDLLLTGDTGPLYIAAAMGTPTLSLWGPTHPTIYGPLTGPHSFILSPHDCTSCCKTRCRDKTNACMQAISPKIVFQHLCSCFHLPA